MRSPKNDSGDCVRYQSTSFIASPNDIDESPSVQPTIVLPERPAFNQEEFDVNFQLKTPQKEGVRDKIRSFRTTRCPIRHLRCSFVQDCFPILVWLPQYNWKRDLLSDVVAGLTVAVLHVSLGMAFASLAQMPPITGLYVSFFSNFLYAFLGGGHHLAFCGTAVISVMVGEVVVRTLHPVNLNNPFYLFDIELNSSDSTTMLMSSVARTDTPEDAANAMMVATAVTFFVGIIHLMTGVLRLGGLSVYLSDTMLSGFLMGAAIHVFTSQLSTLLGITIPRVVAPLRVYKTLAFVLSSLSAANLVTTMTSFATLSTLVITKCLSLRFFAFIAFPLPIELLAVMIGTLVSHYADFQTVYQVDVVGYVATGLPSPIMPSMWLIQFVILDAVTISVVSYAITLSFGLVYAKKYGYKIDSNQELFALGIINMLGSFFACIPTSVGMSRTLAQEAAGCRSLITNLVASLIILLAILFIGPIFYSLPSCILASIVLFALRGMFSQLKQLQLVWALSTLEASLWMVAFLAVILLDVGVGLGIGFLYSLVITVVRTQWPYTCLLGQIPGTGIYLDASKYQAAQVDDGIKIFHFSSFLYFVNKEYFKSELYRLVGMDPTLMKGKEQEIFFTPAKNEHMQLVKQESVSPSYGTLDDSSATNITPTKSEIISGMPSSNQLHHIIIDASAWSYIDLPGIEALAQVVKDFNRIGVVVFIAGCQASISEKLEYAEFQCLGIKQLTFPSIQDAMAYAELDNCITS